MTIISPEDIGYVEKVASSISLGDNGQYNICLLFPFVGSDWLQGWSGGFSPRNVGTVNSAIHNNGNILELVEEEKLRLSQASDADTVSYITTMAHELRRHPMINAFFLGKDCGVSVSGPSRDISYADWGAELAEKHGREISEDKIDLAVCSGALFGNMDPGQIRELEAKLKGQMYDAKPKSFKDEIQSRFYEAMSSDVPESVTPDKSSTRLGNFSRAVFNAVLTGKVNLMDERYLR